MPSQWVGCWGWSQGISVPCLPLCLHRWQSQVEGILYAGSGLLQWVSPEELASLLFKLAVKVRPCHLCNFLYIEGFQRHLSSQWRNMDCIFMARDSNNLQIFCKTTTIANHHHMSTQTIFLLKTTLFKIPKKSSSNIFIMKVNYFVENPFLRFLK